MIDSRGKFGRQTFEHPTWMILVTRFLLKDAIKYIKILKCCNSCSLLQVFSFLWVIPDRRVHSTEHAGFDCLASSLIWEG